MITIKKLIANSINITTGPKIVNPLCFTAVDAGATIAFNKVGSPAEANIIYATEKSGQRAALTWQPYEFNTVVTLENEGDKVYFAAADENDISFYKDFGNYYRFATTEGKRIAASGNIQTLMKADGSRLDISGKNNCYTQMFYQCKSLTTAPELPATTLAEYCYQEMFGYCTSLIHAPELPATTLAKDCYSCMFDVCTSLTQAPELPAMTLAEYCYSCMFQNCTSLTSAPAFPATTLARGCYQYMFYNCTNISDAPIIKTYTSYLYAFDHMLDEFDQDKSSWGYLSNCNWPDLTLSEAESMVLTELIFGYIETNIGTIIRITCKDGSATVYYDSGKSSLVFEY